MNSNSQWSDIFFDILLIWSWCRAALDWELNIHSSQWKFPTKSSPTHGKVQFKHVGREDMYWIYKRWVVIKDKSTWAPLLCHNYFSTIFQSRVFHPYFPTHSKRKCQDCAQTNKKSANKITAEYFGCSC